MKLSVIIPVYNVADYIGECLDSIINQTYRDLEIVVVNDGSTDCSEEIIRRYLSDHRIKLINKPNGGLSDARNAGIDCATGELITFVDGDDVVSADTFEQNVSLFETYHDLDMVQYPMLFYWGSEKQNRHDPEARLMPKEALFRSWWKNELLVYSVCNKIFRKEVFSRIRFPKGRHFEDMYIVPELSRSIRTAFISQEGEYRYRARDGSILNSVVSYHTNRDQLEARLLLYQESLRYNPLRNQRVQFLLEIIWWQLFTLQHYSKEEQERSIIRFSEYPIRLSDVLASRMPFKFYLRILALTGLGFRTVFTLFWSVKKIRRS